MFLPTCTRVCLKDSHHPTGGRPGPKSSNGYMPLPVSEEKAILNHDLHPNFLARQPSFRILLATLTNGLDRFKFAEHEKYFTASSVE
jgi:hypothetical protein